MSCSVGSKIPWAAATVVVVLAEGRGDVDEAGSVFGGDEVAGDDRAGRLRAVGQLEDRAVVGELGELFAGQRLGALWRLRRAPSRRGLSARISVSPSCSTLA